MQCPHVIAEAMNEGPGGSLEVADLHECACEVETGNIDGLPLRCLRRKSIFVDELWPAIIREDGSVEPKSGTNDDTVVLDLFPHLVGTHEADRDEVGSVAVIDTFDIAVEQRVLRLQLIRIQQVVIDRPKVADVVRLPGHPYRIWTGHMDDRGGFDQVVGSFKT